LPTAKVHELNKESPTSTNSGPGEDTDLSNQIVIEAEAKLITLTTPAYLPSGDKDYIRKWRNVLKFTVKRAKQYKARSYNWTAVHNTKM